MNKLEGYVKILKSGQVLSAKDSLKSSIRGSMRQHPFGANQKTAVRSAPCSVDWKEPKVGRGGKTIA